MVPAAGDVPTRARWRGSPRPRRSLYPLAMVDPAGTSAPPPLVGLVAAELRADAGDMDEVLARREELLAALPRLADDAGRRDGRPGARRRGRRRVGAGLPPAAGAPRRAAWAGPLDEARRAGREWLVVEADPTAVMAGVHQSVELHLPTGSAVVSTVEAATSGAHGDVPPRARPGRGEGRRRGHGTVARSAARLAAQVFTDREQWRAAVERLKAELAAGS